MKKKQGITLFDGGAIIVTVLVAVLGVLLGMGYVLGKVADGLLVDVDIKQEINITDGTYILGTLEEGKYVINFKSKTITDKNSKKVFDFRDYKKWNMKNKKCLILSVNTERKTIKYHKETFHAILDDKQKIKAIKQT